MTNAYQQFYLISTGSNTFRQHEAIYQKQPEKRIMCIGKTPYILQKNYNIYMIKPHFLKNHNKKLTLNNPKRILTKENQPFFSQINVMGKATIEGIQIQQSNFFPQKTFSLVKLNRNISIKQQHKIRNTTSNQKYERTVEEKTRQSINGRKILSLGKIDKPSQDLNPTKGQKGIIRDPNAQELTLQIINFLKKQNILHSSLRNYTIRKIDFEQTLHSIFSCFSRHNKENSQINVREKEMINLDLGISNNISSFFEQQMFQIKKQSLKNVSQAIKFKTIIYDYENEVKKTKNEVSALFDEKTALQFQIGAIQTTIQQFKEQIQKNRQQINLQIYSKDKLKQQLCNLQQKKSIISQQIIKNSAILQMAKQTQQKITNYVNIQTNRLIKMASQDYKQVQSDIYQYASYLQSNQLAHDLDFQPLPFKNLQEEVSQSMKNINRSLLQSDQDKGKLMRDFVVQTIQRFKKKDTQMIKLLDFKAKCIRNFIANMKKWLDNWTLKQEYLVNLRNQFYIDTQKIEHQINAVNSLPLCQGCRILLNKDFNVLVDYYKKVQLNYKMGNSFY